MWLFYLAFKNILTTDVEGQKVFTPNGRSGSGYIIPSDEVYKRISRGLVAIFITTIILSIFAALLIIVFNINYFIAILIPIIFFLGAYYWWVRIQTRDLVKKW